MRRARFTVEARSACSEFANVRERGPRGGWWCTTARLTGYEKSLTDRDEVDTLASPLNVSRHKEITVHPRAAVTCVVSLAMTCALGLACNKDDKSKADASVAADAPSEDEAIDLPPGAPFEGTVDVSADLASTGDASDMPEENYSFTLKGKKARWDLYGGADAKGSYRIHDGATNQFFSVMPAAKSTFVTADASILDKRYGDAGAPGPWVFRVVDEHGAFAGLPCERWSTELGKVHFEMCVTKELPPFPLHLLTGALGKVVPFNPDLMDRGVFPLTVIATEIPKAGADAGAKPPRPKDGGLATPDRGALRGRMQVTHVDRRRVRDDVFVVPDYPQTKTETLGGNAGQFKQK